jgi:mannose-1-phosphate guanylyltransferase
MKFKREFQTWNHGMFQFNCDCVMNSCALIKPHFQFYICFMYTLLWYRPSSAFVIQI